MRMSIIAGLLASMSLVPTAAGGEPRKANAEITVWLENFHVVPRVALVQAGQTASRIFAAIGLQIVWRYDPWKQKNTGGFDCPKHTIQIRVRFLERTPIDVTARALARTFPYELDHSRIEVFASRLNRIHAHRGALTGPLLGHVLAHEIGHILQFETRHSAKGILQPDWGDEDFKLIEMAPLEFEPADVELIRTGMQYRLRNCPGHTDTLPQ